MRKVHFIIIGILFTLPPTLFAQSKSSIILADNLLITHSVKCCGLDNCSYYHLKGNPQPEDKNIYKLIAIGQENEIKKYFNEITLDELMRSDTGNIVKAFKKLNTKEKVTRTIWILEEVKNRTFEIKKYVYEELEKVDYNKPSFFLKQLINNYFTNLNEKEVTLTEKVTALQKKMNR
ncbi:MAG: hypothetical protein HOO91_03885 [Bacteroidales bacterium]|nr:hypothetical protein [Bacteroidales bacterium]